MSPLRLHHIAVALWTFFVLLTATAYGLELYLHMALYAFFTGWFTGLTVWTFLLEHNHLFPELVRSEI